MLGSPVYLDWNATTPPLEEVVEAMARAARDAWANPASVHGAGRKARSYVEDARAQIAALVGRDPRDVLLTSGGTEANNLAIRSAFPDRERPWLVTSRLEHPSVTRVAEWLDRTEQAKVHWLRVTGAGLIDLDDLAAILRRENVKLVAIQWVNHETGVVQPVEQACALAHEAKALVHMDAVQGIGKIGPLPANVDSLSIASHKIRGPKGVGALVTRIGVRVEPILLGGAQERGIRPGTVDPCACAGFAVAAKKAAGGPLHYEAVRSLRDALESGFLRAWPKAHVNGTGFRAPHVTNVAIADWNGPELVAAFDLEGINLSSGSACSAGTSDPSPVITAMFDSARAASSVRLSIGDATTMDEVERAIAAASRISRRQIIR